MSAAGSIGTLTFGTSASGADGNLIVNSGATLNLVLGAPGTSLASLGMGSQIVVNGNLTLPASGLNLNLIDNHNAGNLGSLGNGFYRLFSYTGTLSGFDSVNTFPASLTATNYTYFNQNNEIDLQVATTSLTWTGAQGNTANGNTQAAWDHATANWANNGVVTQTAIDGAIESFSDLQYSGGPAVANPNIQVASGGVRPSAVVFANSTAVTYTLTSADGVGNLQHDLGQHERYGHGELGRQFVYRSGHRGQFGRHQRLPQ